MQAHTSSASDVTTAQYAKSDVKQFFDLDLSNYEGLRHG